MGMLLFEAYGVCSLISGGLCLRCLKLWNLCMITTLFTEIWRYAIFLNEVLYNSSFELSQWTQNSFYKFPSLFSNNGNKDLTGCSQCTMDFLSCQRESMHKNVLSLLEICCCFFFLQKWCLTLCDCFFFSLKTFSLMKNTLWKYQILALPLSSKRTKSFEVQMALYCNNILFVLMHVTEF